MDGVKMNNKKKLKIILLAKLSEFFKHCTLHGLYYFYSRANRWVHIFWCFIIAFSIGLCAFLSHMIWEKFVIDPTFTVVETTHYPTGKIPFPAVSICDTELVYGPNTKNITNILHLRGFENDEINDFFRSVTDIKQRGYVVKSHVSKMHVVLESLGYTYNILLDLLKKPCGNLMEECVWRAKSIDCSQMFRPVLTFMGYCCQFDLTYFRSHSEKNTNFAAGTDITEALDITVNTEKFNANGVNADGYVLVYIFDKDSNITVLDSAITVTANTYFDVKVTVWLTDSSKDVKALSLSDRKCFLKTDVITTGGTSYQNCKMYLLMKNIVEECRCLPFTFEYANLNFDFPPCSWSRLICVYGALETVQGNIRDVISNNECYHNCDYVQYETVVEYLKQDRTPSNKRLNSRVTVHFEDNSCMKYRREVLYTWDQMLANLGGIFGLCLGGSIISIIEIVWFVSDLMYTIFVNFNTGRVSPRNRQIGNSIFVISKKNSNNKQKMQRGEIVSTRFKFVH